MERALMQKPGWGQEAILGVLAPSPTQLRRVSADGLLGGLGTWGYSHPSQALQSQHPRALGTTAAPVHPKIKWRCSRQIPEKSRSLMTRYLRSVALLIWGK